MPQLSFDGIAPTATTIAEVHAVISRHAAEIANRDPRLLGLVEHASNVWREASVKSEVVPGRGLCVEYDAALLYGNNRKWRQAMRQIGHDAMRQAVVEKDYLLVGLIVGEARNGRNYFSNYAANREEPASGQIQMDLFPNEPNGQTSLDI
ncbi:hypothetical protein [Candidatus Solirubrobacter pratensis]|uniref:hypothetical protein n=1 Tax=Candidatus Solirubrobacter pratensis TaxID=1298857 RepID=UPI000415190D|nr:hypothetical protein [Candidatus Solirubrobacter pratensis]